MVKETQFLLRENIKKLVSFVASGNNLLRSVFVNAERTENYETVQIMKVVKITKSKSKHFVSSVGGT